ncbi:MAG: bis(5'-nucleosyl)-tetraphosphatase [Promethearchaeota archaeon]|jgi:8-oxo-dGTP pyrophosphatase MutT (NUDIX family)
MKRSIGKTSIKEEFSVAAIVYHKNEYLLLKYGLGHWEFVKGHKEENESDEQTILRELEEETGINDALFIEGFKENYDYYFSFKGQRIHKSVNCYLIKSNSKEVKISYEHEEYAWLPLHKALKRVTYDNAKRLLEKANSFRRK